MATKKNISSSPRTPSVFTPFRLCQIEFINRVVVSPLCMYSANDGVVDDWHVVHLGSRAMGGAGLVMAEMTAIHPDGRISIRGVRVGKMFKKAGLDILDVSSGNVTHIRRPAVSGLFQTPFSEQIRRETGIPTMTVGNIATPEQINEVITG